MRVKLEVKLKSFSKFDRINEKKMNLNILVIYV